MSFWSKLKKGLLLGAAGAVAPFTGGGSLAALPAILGAAAPIIGGIAGERAKGRQEEAQQGQADDRIRAELARLGAQRAQFGIEAPSQRAHQTARGDIMANLQDIQFGPTRGRSQAGGVAPTGGLSAATFGPNTRAAGAKLSELGLSNLGKDTFEVPGLSKRPQANFLDKILGVAGPATALAGALGKGTGQSPAMSFDQGASGGYTISDMLANMPQQTDVDEPPYLPSRSQARVMY